MQSVYRVGFLTIRFAGLVTPTLWMFHSFCKVRSERRKGGFKAVCVYALFKQLSMRFLIRFFKERRKERLRLTNLHDSNYA